MDDEGYTCKFVIILILIVAVADAQICNITQEGFNNCKPAVKMNNPQPPSKECCDAIKNADLNCLCTFANSPILKTLKINKAAALKLPVNCNVDPNFHCQRN